MRLKQHLIYLLNVELILQPSLSDPLRLRKLNERGEEGREWDSILSLKFSITLSRIFLSTLIVNCMAADLIYFWAWFIEVIFLPSMKTIISSRLSPTSGLLGIFWFKSSTRIQF